jgi:branched-chain amino acid transport system substrate-binding protein
MKLAKIGALAATAVLVIAGCSNTPGGSGGASGGTGGKSITIGTEFPMSGAEQANGEPSANGVKLAIKQANAKSSVPGYTIGINVQDDAVNGLHNPQQGATNLHTLVSDTTVAGVVGPFNSNVAQAEIPIGNAAGLLQCSPANTNTGLTYPPDSAQYRPTNPDKINYIRLAAPDSIQGPAGADYTYNDLKATSVYILDDTETFGVGVGNSFSDQFKKDGGTVTKRDSAPKTTTDYTPLFTAAAAAKPAAVYLAGTTPNGMGLAIKQGRTVPGFETIPFMGPDGVADLGPGGTTGATITVAGSAAHDVHGTVAGIHDLPSGSTFVADYTAEYGKAPGAYSAASYACAQVIIAGIAKAVAAGTTDLAAIREAVRANSVAAGNSFDTVVGTVGFDKNGDITTPYMSFYKTDLTAAGGKGDWVYVKQQAFTDPNK